jgi:hypothetical protein
VPVIHLVIGNHRVAVLFIVVFLNNIRLIHRQDNNINNYSFPVPNSSTTTNHHHHHHHHHGLPFRELKYLPFNNVKISSESDHSIKIL